MIKIRIKNREVLYSIKQGQKKINLVQSTVKNKRFINRFLSEYTEEGV